MHTATHMRKHTHRHTQTHRDTHRHTQTHTHLHRHTHTQTNTDTHRRTKTHADTHRHTQTHTDTHRHTAASWNRRSYCFRSVSCVISVLGCVYIRSLAKSGTPRVSGLQERACPHDNNTSFPTGRRSQPVTCRVCRERARHAGSTAPSGRCKLPDQIRGMTPTECH